MNKNIYKSFITNIWTYTYLEAHTSEACDIFPHMWVWGPDRTAWGWGWGRPGPSPHRDKWWWPQGGVYKAGRPQGDRCPHSGGYHNPVSCYICLNTHVEPSRTCRNIKHFLASSYTVSSLFSTWFRNFNHENIKLQSPIFLL